ncbi:MAG: orotate phosphoribosyltransferase [Thalassobius sp.]|nr:orotate phosphoribosyltransferase [Thalassovita sp.]
MRKITPEDEELVKWAMICHASGLLGLIIPYANMLGPYYILKKKVQEFPEIEVHAKAALNFQITMSIYFTISFVLLLVWIGIFGLILLAVYELIVVLLAVLEAHDLEVYEYPLSRTFVE